MSNLRDTIFEYNGAKSYPVKDLEWINGYFFRISEKDTLHICVWPTCGDFHCGYAENIVAQEQQKVILPPKIRVADTFNIAPYLVKRSVEVKSQSLHTVIKATKQEYTPKEKDYSNLATSICFSLLLILTVKYLTDTYEDWIDFAFRLKKLCSS
jgi:hypothetical protein